MKTIETDVLVIGSGIAGLCFALQCAQKYRVIVLSKSVAGETNTHKAQGGIAAALEWPDLPFFHKNDTLNAGAGICDEEAVDFLVEGAAGAIQFLAEAGVCFDRNARGYDKALEGGHDLARVLHTADVTGQSLMKTLLERVKENPRIELKENCMVHQLLVRAGRCLGAAYFPPEGKFSESCISSITMLAAGGAGQLYKTNTNSRVATGDGFALAWKAGAILGNMEFVQFHPTLLYDPGEEAFLISEALRGAGAVLCDEKGRPFMNQIHPMGSLAPRDIVSRGISDQMQKAGKPCVYLDIRGFQSDGLEKHFAGIFRKCRSRGINPKSDLIPVVPAAHYMCGGIRTDLYGKTNIPGLFACGENAFTGVHGANRLASNSLLEGVVFALSAGDYVLRRSFPKPAELAVKFPQIRKKDNYAGKLREMEIELQELMWQKAGIVRSGEELKDTLFKIRELLEHPLVKEPYFAEGIRVQHMLITASLIVEAAWLRKESKGTHYRTDFPEPDKRQYIILQQKGKEPVKSILGMSSNESHIGFSILDF